eukprot:gene34584-39889_t
MSTLDDWYSEYSKAKLDFIFNIPCAFKFLFKIPFKFLFKFLFKIGSGNKGTGKNLSQFLCQFLPIPVTATWDVGIPQAKVHADNGNGAGDGDRGGYRAPAGREDKVRKQVLSYADERRMQGRPPPNFQRDGYGVHAQVPLRGSGLAPYARSAQLTGPVYSARGGSPPRDRRERDDRRRESSPDRRRRGDGDDDYAPWAPFSPQPQQPLAIASRSDVARSREEEAKAAADIARERLDAAERLAAAAFDARVAAERRDRDEARRAEADRLEKERQQQREQERAQQRAQDRRQRDEEERRNRVDANYDATREQLLRGKVLPSVAEFVHAQNPKEGREPRDDGTWHGMRELVDKLLTKVIPPDQLVLCLGDASSPAGKAFEAAKQAMQDDQPQTHDVTLDSVRLVNSEAEARRKAREAGKGGGKGGGKGFRRSPPRRSRSRDRSRRCIVVVVGRAGVALCATLSARDRARGAPARLALTADVAERTGMYHPNVSGVDAGAK